MVILQMKKLSQLKADGCPPDEETKSAKKI